MAAVTVGTSAVQVTGFETTDRLLVQNLGSVPIYFGRASDVTTSTGIKIAAEGAYEFLNSVHAVPNLWLISGTAGQNVRIEAVGVECR